jgi:hypothetical protein
MRVGAHLDWDTDIKISKGAIVTCIEDYYKGNSDLTATHLIDVIYEGNIWALSILIDEVEIITPQLEE